MKQMIKIGPFSKTSQEGMPQDNKCKTLSMRPVVLARDHIAIGGIKDNEAKQECALIANLCTVSPEVIGALTLPDYKKCQDALIEASGSDGEEAPTDPEA